MIAGNGSPKRQRPFFSRRLANLLAAHGCQKSRWTLGQIVVHPVARSLELRKSGSRTAGRRALLPEWILLVG